MPEEAHLYLNGVSKRFDGLVAVDRVSLSIPKGSFATLLGPSGCGKTTTLRMIAGFHEPDSGAISLNGRRINDLPANRRGTAMVFQDYALFPHMTVHDNVAYGLKVAAVPKTTLRERVASTLAFVGLEKLGSRYPNQLSGGQQQRVALARALVIEPQVLLLDEPLSNLDAKLREQLRWELRGLQKRLGMTFVYVTHDQEEALSMSDWIAVMNEGRVEQAGPPAEIYYRPRTEFVAGFVGIVNLIPGRIVERQPGRVIVAVDGLRLTLDCDRPPVSDEVKLSVRPESLAIGAADAMRDGIAGLVSRSAFLGDLMRYWVDIGGREWIVDHADPGDEPLTDTVVLSLKAGRAHLIPPLVDETPTA